MSWTSELLIEDAVKAPKWRCSWATWKFKFNHQNKGLNKSYGFETLLSKHLKQTLEKLCDMRKK